MIVRQAGTGTISLSRSVGVRRVKGFGVALALKTHSEPQQHDGVRSLPSHNSAQFDGRRPHKNPAWSTCARSTGQRSLLSPRCALRFGLPTHASKYSTLAYGCGTDNFVAPLRSQHKRPSIAPRNTGVGSDIGRVWAATGQYIWHVQRSRSPLLVGHT